MNGVNIQTTFSEHGHEVGDGGMSTNECVKTSKPHFETKRLRVSDRRVWTVRYNPYEFYVVSRDNLHGPFSINDERFYK